MTNNRRDNSSLSSSSPLLMALRCCLAIRDEAGGLLVACVVVRGKELDLDGCRRWNIAGGFFLPPLYGHQSNPKTIGLQKVLCTKEKISADKPILVPLTMIYSLLFHESFEKSHHGV